MILIRFFLPTVGDVRLLGPHSFGADPSVIQEVSGYATKWPPYITSGLSVFRHPLKEALSMEFTQQMVNDLSPPRLDIW